MSTNELSVFVDFRTGQSGVGITVTGSLGYITSGENLNYREAFELIADTLQVRPPRRRIPDFVVNVMGMLGSVVAAVSGKPPVLSYPMVRLSHTDSYYSNRKAVEELGMPRSDLRAAVRECFNWLRDHGYLRGK